MDTATSGAGYLKVKVNSIVTSTATGSP
jgi:hypothetical protein